MKGLSNVLRKQSLFGSAVKNPPANARDTGLIPESGGEGNGNSLQYSCLENSRDRGAWRAIVHGVTKSDTTECAHTQTHEDKT